jgi:hypothetical protein
MRKNHPDTTPPVRHSLKVLRDNWWSWNEQLREWSNGHPLNQEALRGGLYALREHLGVLINALGAEPPRATEVRPRVQTGSEVA